MMFKNIGTWFLSVRAEILPSQMNFCILQGTNIIVEYFSHSYEHLKFLLFRLQLPQTK